MHEVQFLGVIGQGGKFELVSDLGIVLIGEFVGGVNTPLVLALDSSIE